MVTDQSPTTTASPGAPVRAVGDLESAVAGVVGVGVALALLELVGGLFASVPAVVSSVGEFFIPFTPEWLKDVAIDLFDTSDKGVLVGGVIVVSLLIGGPIGRRSRFAPGVAWVSFGLFGVFGAVAAMQTAGSALVPVVTSTAFAITAGVATVLGLLRVAALRDAPGPDVDASAADAWPTLGRRPFVAAAGTAAVGAVVVGATGRAMLRRRADELAIDAASLGLPTPNDLAAPVTSANRLDVDGITPIVVPNDDFYRIDTALQVPLVNPNDWTLRVTGMVDTELELTYDDLVERELIERHITLSCVSNEVGDDLVGNATWWGTRLDALLDEAGVQPGATQIVGRSVDGFTAGFPTEAAFDGRDAIVAVGMNGEPLPPAHGYPARLVVPGLYGYVSATKWLAEIELTTLEGFDAYWIPRGWGKFGPIKTQSRIDVPRRNETLPTPGPTVVAGIAWAPHRGIQRVEVRLDSDDWVEAELSEPLSQDAWVQWRATVDVPAGRHTLQVRATDGTGETQTAERAPVRPDGATGHHTVVVTA